MASSTRGKISSIASFVLLCVLVLILVPEPIEARPPMLLSRQRRVSDQRLAELETIISLTKMKGKPKLVPIAFGVVDPTIIGRKRRSATDDRLETIERILQAASQNPDIVSDEDQKILSFGMNDEGERLI